LKIKTKNLVVFIYALFILGLGFVFLSQTSKLGAGYSKTSSSVAKTSQAVSQGNTTSNNVNQNISLSKIKEPVYSYELVDKSPDLKININQIATISLKIRNNGNITLYSGGSNPLYLATSHPEDRESIFFNDGLRGWISANRIKMVQRNIDPEGMADFTFQIKAPAKPGIYREFFTPVLEKIKWLDDSNIYWDITVIDPNKPNEELKVTVDGKPAKYINVALKEQFLYAYENNIVKYRFQTSTGMAGMDTPTGTFQIYNKFPVQYSPEYQLYMDNWMAFTQSGSHGIHSLPYWPLKNGGRLYEGENHLGTPVSHGCIRVSLENSVLLYDWAEVGIPVIVEK
jgi:lipoprotein-anchoring transpeptidase ErfK/SrfK